MDSEKKRIRKKQLIIVAICMVVAVTALFGLTFTKYSNEEISGQAEYEPALFNTVLLGQLVAEDLESLSPDIQYQYSMKVYTCPECHAEITNGSEEVLSACPYCGTENNEENVFSCVEHTQTVNGEKISATLDLSQMTEFGVETGSNILQISPGSAESNQACIYFTVTNGTTVTDVTDEEGAATARIKNLAESDIRYTLHVATTNNLPLQYELYAIEKDASGNDVETAYELKDTLEQTVTEVISGEYAENEKTATYTKKQSNSDYVVADSDKASDFVDGSRILKCNSDNSITVHRYKLVVKWPSESVTEKVIEENETTSVETETKYNNDLSYMKELENIEVILEVESYVNYLDWTDSSDISSQGIVTLLDNQTSDGLYLLKKIKSVDNSGILVYNDDIGIFGKKTIRFDALVGISNSIFANATGVSAQECKSYNYQYPLFIYNTDRVTADWEDDDPDTNIYEDALNGKSDTRAENGHTNSDGHYTYSSDKLSGDSGYDYHVALAVPSGGERVNASGIDRASEGYAYYITYKGTTYYGSLTTDEFVQSGAETYVEDDSSESSVLENITQYKVLRFYDNSGNELSLNFSGEQLQKEELTFYMGSDTAYVKSKDDFKIYITRTVRESEPEPDTESGD